MGSVRGKPLGTKQFRRWLKGDNEKMAKRVLVDFDRLAYNRYLHRYDKEWLVKRPM